MYSAVLAYILRKMTLFYQVKTALVVLTGYCIIIFFHMKCTVLGVMSTVCLAKTVKNVLCLLCSLAFKGTWPLLLY